MSMEFNGTRTHPITQRQLCNGAMAHQILSYNAGLETIFCDICAAL